MALPASQKLSMSHYRPPPSFHDPSSHAMPSSDIQYPIDPNFLYQQTSSSDNINQSQQLEIPLLGQQVDAYAFNSSGQRPNMISPNGGMPAAAYSGLAQGINGSFLPPSYSHYLPPFGSFQQPSSNTVHFLAGPSMKPSTTPTVVDKTLRTLPDSRTVVSELEDGELSDEPQSSTSRTSALSIHKTKTHSKNFEIHDKQMNTVTPSQQRSHGTDRMGYNEFSVRITTVLIY